jgi:hypothetical protein
MAQFGSHIRYYVDTYIKNYVRRINEKQFRELFKIVGAND